MSSCSPNNNDNNRYTCYSLESLQKIAKAYNKKMKGGQNININQNKKDLWSDIRNRLSGICGGDEICWMHLKFIKGISDPSIFNKTFKPTRPKGKETWLSNLDIDAVMRQFEDKYTDFVFIGPVPIDFSKIVTEVKKINISALYRKNKKRIGIVFNLDPHDQPGSHWVTLFVDMTTKNKATIEFFDSIGEPPVKEIGSLINKIKKSGKKNNINFDVLINDSIHQKKNNECGVYAINYIVKRLHGNSFYVITNNVIRDSRMNGMRSLFFSPYKEYR